MFTAEDFPAPPAPLKRRVMASLHSNGLLRPRTPWSRAPLAIAAGMALFVAGTQLDSWTARGTTVQPSFALLLYEDSGFAPTAPAAELVREYTAWAGVQAENGALVLAEELDPVVQVAGGDGPIDAGAVGRLTGVFIVRAADRAAALELATGHPHLRYGGRIVVRGFVRHR